MPNVSRILDTNVLINANGDQSPQSSAQCKDACLKLLVSAMANDYQIVIDGSANPDASLILTEYRNNLRAAGMGFGDMFFRWLLMNWQNLVVVPITPIHNQTDAFEEFPDDKRLKHFDPRDRKWIAAARACHMYEEMAPEIIQSADFKWREYIDIFKEHDVNVVFVGD